MARVLQIEGMEGILDSLQKVNKDLGKDVQRGLTQGGLLIQREAQKITPVDTGNLKNSAGTRVFGSGWATEVVVFYTAEYAVYVHENTQAAHGEAFNKKYRKEIASKTNRTRNRGSNQTAKFLEIALKRNWETVLQMVAKKAEL